VQADALASLIRATLTPIIGPLVAELAASRQTIERQADQLVSQAETIGTLRAEVDALRASQQPQAASTAPEPMDPPNGAGTAAPTAPLAAAAEHPGADIVAAAGRDGDRRRRGAAVTGGMMHCG
jgi:hypothetical protein